MSERSSYLRYLPAIYSSAPSAFVGQYLKIFEKILTGIDDSELAGRKGIQELLSDEVIGNLFYPRLSFLFHTDDSSLVPPVDATEQDATVLASLNRYIQAPVLDNPVAGFLAQPESQPPEAAIEAWLNDFLVWLGSWVGLLVDHAWSIDKKRAVMAQIMALYRIRGTVQGMSFLCNLLLELPLPMTGVQYDAGGRASAVHGCVALVFSNPDAPDIVIGDHVPAAGVGQGEHRPRVAGMQAGPAFVLQERYLPGSPVVSGYLPWAFQVQIVLPSFGNPGFILTEENVAQVQALQAQLQQLLPKIKPALSRPLVTIVPSMQLLESGRATALDVNTLLGEQGTTS